ncbi:hypothetical protein [Herminiimonas sp. CN]|uniref:hypothetical protein n=1 Tax=Herminiimonas sp. CN TaxID=1349818 RepID=UPI0004740679|nr:hypothetical protein [Herminiimonas sp. CN]
MKRFLFATAVAVTAVTAPALAADVGVSVSVGQPGFYGQINIGNVPPPQLIYPQPLIIQPAPTGVRPRPIYLHVPPGHAKNWRKHCRRYNACGQPVYFVQDNWYNDVYVPRYRDTHRSDQGERDGGRGYDRNNGHDRGNDRGNNGHNRGNDRGNNGHNRGNDRGNDKHRNNDRG